MTAPFDGDARTGTAGVSIMVVKFQTGDQAPGAFRLVALARQKYFALLFRPVTCCEFAVMPDWPYTVLAKVETVATWRPYDEAVESVPQLRVIEVG